MPTSQTKYWPKKVQRGGSEARTRKRLKPVLKEQKPITHHAVNQNIAYCLRHASYLLLQRMRLRTSSRLNDGKDAQRHSSATRAIWFMEVVPVNTCAASITNIPFAERVEGFNARLDLRVFLSALPSFNTSGFVNIQWGCVAEEYITWKSNSHASKRQSTVSPASNVHGEVAGTQTSVSLAVLQDTIEDLLLRNPKATYYYVRERGNECLTRKKDILRTTLMLELSKFNALMKIAILQVKHGMPVRVLT
ncbi:hypothetical protein BJ508DRAFT_312377 [Ascobolus immersus RN42]|uniref:Uncharacterized protein n=1 Tax=Ascobolus immersus RN42 TaxID=1160509 RepID=A0A3N4HMH1_ASCIM|nr:hypothetical protein BJ508DRAFT_312377 [Ascobolus immersus RN42]